MRRILFIAILTVVSCLFPLLAQAQEEFKPEEKVPGWLSEPPYQRNVFIDFSEDPEAAPGPIPGAVYSGLADADVWGSDLFTYTGDVTLDQLNDMIGIDNGGLGAISMRLANLPILNPVKRIYVEGIVSLSNIFDILNISATYLLPDDSYTIIDSDYGVEEIDPENPDPNRKRLFLWAIIKPNPPWEAAAIVLGKPAEPPIIPPIPITGDAWIEYVHIATECVPNSDCISDTDSDGVVDGADLAEFIQTELYISVKKFAEQFGLTDCKAI